jgi:glycosyltransferase involved in cell wall biosynthesis
VVSAGKQRILVVSPYPPQRDGLGAYAVQQVKALRHDGHQVEVLSPEPSAAHHHASLVGPAGAKALARTARGFDRVIIHFHPDLFYEVPSTPTSRISAGMALAKAIRSMPPVEIRLHEVDHRWASAGEQVEASTRSGRVAETVFAMAAKATRSVFQAAAEVSVHDAGHRDVMVQAFGVRPERVRIVDHGGDFTPHTAMGRADARASFGLPDDQHIFVCIGFVQPHKGFDRAAAAMRGLGADGLASLHIVGSVRVDDPGAAEHLRELEALEAQVAGVHLHVGYVSDELFDRWIVAADTVVLPYRHIWSSGVAERARLHHRPVIATRVGGLAEQLAPHPGSVIVDDNAGLAAAMAAAVRGDGSGERAARAASGSAGGWSFDGTVDREAVMAEVRRRSAALRGVKVAPTAGQAPRRTDALVTTPLRRLRPVPLPTATSARPGVSTVKKLIRRIIAWEVDPLRDQVTRLHEASLKAAETTEARLEQVEHDLDDE